MTESYFNHRRMSVSFFTQFYALLKISPSIEKNRDLLCFYKLFIRLVCFFFCCKTEIFQ